MVRLFPTLTATISQCIWLAVVREKQMFNLQQMIRNKEIRWENATESEKWHIQEERELARKINILKTFVQFDIHTGNYIARLYAGEFVSKKKAAVYEWALNAHFGIKVKLLKLEMGLRFQLLPNSAPIIDEAHRRAKKIECDPRVSALKEAALKLKKTNPAECQKLLGMVDDIAKTIE